MGFGKKLVFAALCALWVGCASGDTSGDSDDAAPGDAAGGAIDAAAPIPDAGEPKSTCEACTANHQCPDDHVCATIGDTKACVPACSESDPTCPEGFMCGGIKMTFCAPVDGLCCIDGDDDTYGTGVDCAGPDCNDDDPDIHPGADDVCNGEDDDCDPATEDGSTDPAVGVDCDGDDTDLCEEGLTYCDAGSLLCDDTTGDILDLCDGVDNDCNTATLDGSDDPAFGMACDSPGDPDLCFDDMNFCNSVLGMIECQDLAGGALDLCDGLDNDCNPATADGDGDPAVGVACDGTDADLCNEGVTVCMGGGIVCNDPNDADPELCNGFDDDCNPSTLDGSGDPDVGVMCDGPDTDLCEEGVRICSSGVKICTDSTGNDVEICNGFDDDCDGIADDLVPSSVCPGQHPGAVHVGTWTCSGMCGIGSCSGGFGNFDGDVTNGCECGPLDTYADSCAGTGTGITVTTGATVTMSGYVESPTVGDFLKVNFNAPAIPGQWTPKIELVSPPGAGFNMDVLTSGCTISQCDTNRSPASLEENANNVTVWEQGYLSTGYGSTPTDLTAKPTTVVIRVYRAGGDLVCSTYQVQITNP